MIAIAAASPMRARMKKLPFRRSDPGVSFPPRNDFRGRSYSSTIVRGQKTLGTVRMPIEYDETSTDPARGRAEPDSDGIAPGTRLAHFAVEKLLGRGGM